MSHKSLAVCLAAASALGMTAGAVAQSSGAGSRAEGPLEEIVVTGSRIVRKDFVAESPIMTIDRALLDMSGPQTLEMVFNTLPQFQASNEGSSSSPARQGRQNANLRGLGIQRSLILLEGRRMTPSDPSGAVDLNTIPTSLVEDIEVITGGASAVYGSDAMAGVVNVKLKRDFEGVQLDGTFGIAEENDAEALDLALTLGGNFAEGRGNIVASIGYYDREAVQRSARPFFAKGRIAGQLQGGRIIASATNLPSEDALRDIFADQYGAEVPNINSPLVMYPDGTLFSSQSPISNFDPSIISTEPDGVGYVVDGTRVGFPQGQTYPLQLPLERINTFVRGRYDITDSVEVYAQFSSMEYDSAYSRQGWSANSADGTPQIPATNPFISPDLAHILASRPDPDAPFTFASNTGRVALAEYDFNYQLNDVLIGLAGDLGFRDWTFDVYASHGKMKAREQRFGFIDYEAWQMLVNAPDGGESVCPGGFNPFAHEMMSQHPEQQACYDLLAHDLSESTDIEQNVIEGVIQGALMDLPAGEMRFAAGLTYREQSYDYQPDEGAIREATMPNQPTSPTGGGYDVFEVFGEVNVPVIGGLPLVEQLAVGLAYRYSDYNLIGSIDTYKVSLDWQISDSFRIRSSQQQAIRAPALGELYRPAERSSSGIGPTSQGGGDPCDYQGRLRDPSINPNHELVRQLCLQQGVPEQVIDIYTFSGSSVSGVASGNENLQEETADTFTAGVVWQSGFDAPMLQNMQLAVDYYDIEIEDAIGILSASVGLSRCFNEDGQSNPSYDPSSFFCQLTTRTVDGGVRTQLEPTLNLGAYKTSGVDVQFDWDFALQDAGLDAPGAMRMSVIVAHIMSQKIQNLEGEPFTDYAGTIGNSQIDSGAISHPEWRANVNVGYNYGPFDVSMQYQWIDSMYHASDAGTGERNRPGVSSRQYVDLLGSWNISDTTKVSVGVLNLFDKEPPLWTADGFTDLALYDKLQRRYFLRASHRF